MDVDELCDRADEGEPEAIAELASRDIRALRKKLADAKDEADEAVRLLQRYVVRLPPQKPGSTDGDTQAFLDRIGRPASASASESEEIPF